MSVSQKADTLVKKDFRPSGIRLGTDLFSLIRTPVDDSFSGWEISADVGFYRYYLTIETGQWQRDFNASDEVYDNNGYYSRVGVDVNFLKDDPERNMLFLGARYGFSTFSENLRILSDDVWNAGASSYSNMDTKASWAEVTGGLKVKIWKYFWLGYTARYKFALNTKETTNLKPNDVPGYGQTNKNVTWGFNYQMLFMIPFKGKTKVP